MSTEPIIWLGAARRAGVTVARIGRQGDRFVAEWRGVAQLTVGRDGEDMRLIPVGGADPLQLAKLRGGAVRVLVRSLQGKLGLHGAAVAIDGVAVVLLGDSGDGKSTTAAALGAHPDCALLSDDAVALECAPRWHVVPLETIHFLDEPSVRALGFDTIGHRIPTFKSAVTARRAAKEDAPLVGIVRLVFDDSTSVAHLRRLSLVDAMAGVIRQTLRLALDSGDHHRVEMDLASNLVTAVPAYELRRPRRLDALSESVHLLRSMVTQ